MNKGEYTEYISRLISEEKKILKQIQAVYTSHGSWGFTASATSTLYSFYILLYNS